jgi:3-(3-hydroxy-phenyl)propionate hydroxylase
MDGQLNTDVLVVGAGPCGITLGNLLGLYGIRAVVVDADSELYEFPRAVGIDDESLRTYQTVGVIDRLLEDIVQNTPIRYYTSWGRLIAHVEPSVRPFGWPRRNLFLQPHFEAALREHIESYTTVELRLGHQLQSYTQDATGVTATLRAGESTLTVNARYLVGADGGRSTVRGLAGIELLGSTAPEKWLVVDVAEDELDEPYSAVYCDPERPVLVIPLPYGHRRFEFKITATDDEDELTDHEYVLRTLLAPRYGSVRLPRVLRSRVYLHHSRTADRFQDRRVFLAGDAAHLQPPFFGQGMNSGIRDATNLAWKLAAVLTGAASDRLLSTYDSERRDHASKMVNFATRIGKMYSPHSRVTEHARDVVFRGVQRIPGAKEYILQMKYKPMPRYVTGAVLPYGGKNPDTVVGRMFIQPDVEYVSGERARLDQCLGPGFAIVGVHVDPRSVLGDDAAQWWRIQGARFVNVAAQRTGPGPEPGDRRKRPSVEGDSEAAVVEDVDGAFRDWLLRRPGDQVIVIRPDRYVAAVCRLEEFERVTMQLRDVLGHPEALRHESA